MVYRSFVSQKISLGEKLSELRHRRAEARRDGYALMRVTRTCLSVDFKSTKCDIKNLREFRSGTHGNQRMSGTKSDSCEPLMRK